MSNVADTDLKETFKSAIVEVLQERRDLVKGILEEIFEDIALSRAIGEGEQTPVVSRDRIFELLENSN